MDSNYDQKSNYERGDIKIAALPYSEESERAVIGSMLIDEGTISIAEEILTKEDFYNKTYGIYFETILEITDENLPVDSVILQERLGNKNISPEYASIPQINSFVDSVPVAVNIKHYANIVKEKSLLRAIIKVTSDISEACRTGELSVDQILDKTENDIFHLLQKKGQRESAGIREIVKNVLNKIRESAKIKGNITGVATGFIDLDYMTSGLQPSDLIIIAARPSMGKTALALNIADNVSVQQQKTVAIFSLEMSKEQLVNRLVSMETHIDAQKLKTGRLSDDEWTELIEGSSQLAKSKLIIDDTPAISVSEMRTKCRKIQLDNPDLSLIIVDYLQLMTVNKKSESKQQEVSDISRSLKALARELNVPVITLSQLSRQVESRKPPRPMLSDLRESGAIEQDADVVMFIYRDEYYNEKSEKKGQAEIIIGKQRNGPTGTVDLAWISEYTKFANLERSDQH